MKYGLLILTVVFISSTFAQNKWEWTELSPLPLSTTNNAVCGANINNNKFVYSFGGIRDSLQITDIHKQVLKYDVSTNLWKKTADIPDSSGKIGNSASFVDNKIYLIGGKYINIDSTETVANKVHVYNVFLDTFESNGSSMPFPSYDHVQSVWKDSLIFVVGGTNYNENAPFIQIYNPYFDSWSIVPSTVNEFEYNILGGSGYILGDTVFYYGGIKQDDTFIPTNILRKGVINPENPLDISWEQLIINTQTPTFRGACSGHKNTLFWIGGSGKSYDYNAISYIDSTIVVGNNQMMQYNIGEKEINYYTLQYDIMDLRGIAKLGGGNWIVAGGIEGLKASDKVYLLHNPELSDIETAVYPPYFQIKEDNDKYTVITENVGEIIIYDLAGRVVYRSLKQLADLYIGRSELNTGFLLFVYNNGINLPVFIKKINLP